MFILRCTKCSREQQWGSAIVLGQNTEIEITGGAIYCSCGAGVEEKNGRLEDVCSQ